MANQREEKLRQEILDDASQKAERLIARAKVSADKIIAEAEKLSEARRKERLEAVEVKAERECAAILLEVRRESHRRWLLERESCLDACFAEALDEAERAAGDEHIRSLAALAKEAIAAIGCRDMRVSFPEADSGVVTSEWLEALARETFGGESPSFVLEPKPESKPGLSFATLDGARTFENTYAARLERMRGDLRREIVK